MTSWAELCRLPADKDEPEIFVGWQPRKKPEDEEPQEAERIVRGCSYCQVHVAIVRQNILGPVGLVSRRKEVDERMKG